MEDAHFCAAPAPGTRETAVFAVYDGHGGPSIAEYAARELHGLITGSQAFREGDTRKAMADAFLRVDHNMMRDFSCSAEGSTALFVLVRGNTLHCVRDFRHPRWKLPRLCAC